ncbi:selenium metabolism-associated LysR family transcriptional regulator [Desulfobacula sp.]
MSNIDFNFRELEIFSRVVELESFSKASQAVFLAQASVSERIRTLEQKIGTRLLDRMGRKVVPTSAGELLYKHAIILLDMKETAALEMESFLGLEQGEISMGASTVPGEYILPEVISQFSRKHKKVSVNLAIADSNEIKTRVLAGEFELGIVGSKSRDAKLIYQELWKDELVVAIPQKHPWSKRKSISIEDLGKEPFIMREKGSGTLEILESYLNDLPGDGIHTLNVSARFGSSTAVKEGVRSGLGLSIISSRAIKTEVRAGLLKSLKIKGISMSRNFYLIRNRLRIASPSCKAMLDFLLTSKA